MNNPVKVRRGIGRFAVSQNILRLAALVALPLSALPAAAAVTITNCGSVINSITTANTSASQVASAQFVPIAYAYAGVTIPPGTTRCIRVRFSTQVEGGSNVFVRARAGRNSPPNQGLSVPLNPDANPKFVSIADFGGTTRSFEWTSRLPPGDYTVNLQATTNNPSYTAIFGPWTMTVEVTN